MEKQLEDALGKMQIQNQQLQTILLQRQTLMVQNSEIEKALEEIEKSSDDIFKSVGPILVRTKKDDIKKELEEQKDEIQLKLKTFDSQEKKIKEHLKDAQERVQKLMPVGQGG